jgi:hypothetical protein
MAAAVAGLTLLVTITNDDATCDANRHNRGDHRSRRMLDAKLAGNGNRNMRVHNQLLML